MILKASLLFQCVPKLFCGNFLPVQSSIVIKQFPSQKLPIQFFQKQNSSPNIHSFHSE